MAAESMTTTGRRKPFVNLSAFLLFLALVPVSCVFALPSATFSLVMSFVDAGVIRCSDLKSATEAVESSRP